MRLRPEVRVGLIVFIALVSLIAVYLFLGGLVLGAHTYFLYAIFDNIQTVERGTDVRMAGVKIGRVHDIRLTPQTKARVIMRIEDTVKVPEGSIARISSAGVLGNFYIEIVPSESRAHVRPWTTLKTVEITTLNDLLDQASGLMEGIQGLTSDLKVTASGLNKILGDEQLAQSVKQTALNLEQASASGLALAEQLNRTVAGATPDIQQSIRRVSLASERLMDISQDFAVVSRNLRAGLIEGGGMARVQQILANAEATSANLVTASEGLAGLTGDEDFLENIRVTAEQARRASTEIAELAERLGRIGRRRDRDEETKPVYVPQSGLRFDTYTTPSENDIRVDVNYTFRPFGKDHFYRLGLFDLGENTRVNLMYGNPLGQNSAIRYGLYASRIGIGYDRVLGDKGSVHADLFRPNDLNLELKGMYQINPNWGLWLGTDNLLDDANLLFGVQYKK